MISIEGGCNKCGKLMQSKAFDHVTGEIDTIMICKECQIESKNNERDKKLKKVLRRGMKERIMNFVNSVMK